MRAVMRIDPLAHLHIRWPLRIGMYTTVLLGGVTQGLLLIEQHPATGATATVLHGCLLATIAVVEGASLTKFINLSIAQLAATGMVIGVLSTIAALVGIVVGSALIWVSFLFTVDGSVRDSVLGWLAVTSFAHRRQTS